jgi:O-antigen/teichoic acid export membrane protein
LLIGRNFGALGVLVATGGGAMLTLGLSAGILASKIVPGYRWRFEFSWSLLRDKLNYTLGNHFSQLLLSMPQLVYPLLVTALLGAQANAYFYTSWMIANLLFILPVSVATSAFAQSSDARISKGKTFRNATGLTVIGLVPIVLAMVVFSSQLLAFFGKGYAEQGHDLLTWLVVSIFTYTFNILAITYLRTKYNLYNLNSISGIALVFWLSRGAVSSSKSLFVRRE